MIYRIFSQKDTFITDHKKNSVAQTGSNFGASEMLHVYKKAGVSGAIGQAGSASLARTLLYFDLSEIAALTASGDAPSSGSVYKLKLHNARHANTLPASFDIEVFALSSSWDEGKGIDTDTFLDLGYANWDKRTSTSFWTSTGGDIISTMSSSAHFDVGSENLHVDVSQIVGSWLTGGLPNNGFMVKLQGAQESGSTDYYLKKFHGRETHFFDKRPTLEMLYDDSLKDDRGVFLFDVTSSLYLYNKQKGQLTNISGVGTGQNVLTVKIADLSGTILTVSGSHTGFTGIYSASFSLPTGSHSGSAFSDKWGLNGASYMTGAFTPHNDGAAQSIAQKQYSVSVKNKSKEYELGETIRFNLFVKTRNYNPAVVLTGSLNIGNEIIEKGYYRVDNATTKEHVIPLGTGSVETTRLSYDKDGNYFKLYTNSLARDEVYELVFFFDVDGQLQKAKDTFKFRII